MGRSSSDIVDYCNECLTLFPNSIIAQNTLIIILLETLLPQLCKIFFSILFIFYFLFHFFKDDPLAPIAKLTDALNRVRQDDKNQLTTPSICGKAYFSIRNGKYSTALELLLTVDQEDGK